MTRYYAKETCSCLFVIEQSQEYCKNALKQEGRPTPALSIDHHKKTVHATLFVFFNAQAKRIDRYQGCRLSN